ncbi:hypothetical protein BKA64DRAFT_714229 [Cadophora sp. MPI-SDFR-AT-0126]|nr:hypothetical protein BKA61DRAFT_681930 [Leptodontidium sp. MPI-SDFR-AT-0119]KAH7379052.1 hypothetical protein BKA64DRAFT_714229 [Leotiomycetes sp. MPI-SDFR-AT-0126]
MATWLAYRMEPSDIIAIFAGAKVPYVLRAFKDQDKYSLIGECYVHGLMEGEAFEELEQGKRKLETFAVM